MFKRAKWVNAIKYGLASLLKVKLPPKSQPEFKESMQRSPQNELHMVFSSLKPSWVGC